MLKVKHFICGATHTALEYFDEDVNKWIRKHNVRDIKKVSEFYGQSPVGMSGHQENVLFVSLWYEAQEETEAPKKADFVNAAAG
jgi:hypothetical protein